MKIYFIIIAALVLAVSCGNRAKNRENGTSTPTAGHSVDVGKDEKPATGQSGQPAGEGGQPAGQGGQSATGQNPTSAARTPIKQYTYKVLETYPHDTGSYTQGLFWHDGHLYEGTGQKGESRLMKIELKTGKVVQQVKLPSGYFGEGIAWLDGKIYQITWTQGRAFVYDGKSLERIRDFTFRGEGWGLTTDGQKLYMSDGTDKIYVRDPETFLTDKTITVTIGRNRQLYINELEWVDGEIWANIYKYGENRVVRIDPATGRITGIINFDGIQAPEDFEQGVTDVFNGIAYDPATGNIYVTGKYWNKLYRVEVVEN